MSASFTEYGLPITQVFASPHIRAKAASTPRKEGSSLMWPVQLSLPCPVSQASITKYIYSLRCVYTARGSSFQAHDTFVMMGAVCSCGGSNVKPKVGQQTQAPRQARRYTADQQQSQSRHKPRSRPSRKRRSQSPSRWRLSRENTVEVS